jgi:hypothetical protein
MSVFTTGFFFLAEVAACSHRTSIPRNRSPNDSVLHSAEADIPAQIRMSAENTLCLPDNTVVMLSGKLTCDSLTTALINSISCFPLPGDSTVPDYADHIPDMAHQRIVITGNAVGTATTNAGLIGT